MALIDATDRFAARREAARQQSGQFGEQQHSAPELTLAVERTPEVEEETPSLEEVFDQMNELGELDNDLTSPETDTYTGTQEQRDHDRRVRELNTLLTDAGIDRDALSEKALAQIQDGMFREEKQKASAAAYRARTHDAYASDEHAHSIPRTPDALAARDAVTQIIEARGYALGDYDPDSLQYMENWAREQMVNGTLDADVAEEVARSKAEREERESSDRHNQIVSLGDLTDDVWEDALEENRLRAQQRIRGYRPTNFVPLKETNGLIRNDLKKTFGTHKFSVRGESYSGGASTNVSWVDGPPAHEVDGVAKAYAGASFDGMTDMKSYHSAADVDSDGIPISTHYAADYVFTRRDFSDSVKSEAERYLVQAYADQGQVFDPNERGRYLSPPQALYNRIGNAQSGSGSYGYSLRGGDQSAAEILAIASTLIADERWAKQQKS